MRQPRFRAARTVAETRIGVPCRCGSGICASPMSTTVIWSAAVVRPGVSGPQQPGQRLTGVVQPDGDRVETEAAFERRRRRFFLAEHGRAPGAYSRDLTGGSV